MSLLPTVGNRSGLSISTTSTSTLSVLTQPLESVTTRVYVVDVVGQADVEDESGSERPVAGIQVYEYGGVPPETKALRVVHGSGSGPGPLSITTF